MIGQFGRTQSQGAPRVALPQFVLWWAVWFLGACAGPSVEVDPDRVLGPWDRGFEPPAPLSTGRLLLEPARVEHAEREHQALLSSAEHLRSTVFDAWPPADYDLAQNRRDLSRHSQEFETARAYTYVVLSPDQSRSLGAVFLKPARPSTPGQYAVQLTYWVAAREIPLGMDEHLLDHLLPWLQDAWGFHEVLVPLRIENRRAASLVRGNGLFERAPPSFGFRLFAWPR